MPVVVGLFPRQKKNLFCCPWETKSTRTYPANGTRTYSANGTSTYPANGTRTTQQTVPPSTQQTVPVPTQQTVPVPTQQTVPLPTQQTVPVLLTIRKVFSLRYARFWISETQNVIKELWHYLTQLIWKQHNRAHNNVNTQVCFRFSIQRFELPRIFQRDGHFLKSSTTYSPFDPSKNHFALQQKNGATHCHSKGRSPCQVNHENMYSRLDQLPTVLMAKLISNNYITTSEKDVTHNNKYRRSKLPLLFIFGSKNFT